MNIYSHRHAVAMTVFCELILPIFLYLAKLQKTAHSLQCFIRQCMFMAIITDINTTVFRLAVRLEQLGSVPRYFLHTILHEVT